MIVICIDVIRIDAEMQKAAMKQHTKRVTAVRSSHTLIRCQQEVDVWHQAKQMPDGVTQRVCDLGQLVVPVSSA